VDDLAALAVNSGYAQGNFVWDAVGPEDFTFRGMVEKIGQTIGHPRPLLTAHPQLALKAAQFLSLFVRDVLLTSKEVDGLMANLLVSQEPPRCPTRLSDWLVEHKSTVSVEYASELKRHF
jgi:NADH dehydrogenase